MEDAKLMALLRKARVRNRRRALNRLLEGVRPHLVRYIRGQVDSRPSPDALAEELAQETLLRVGRSIASCRAQSASSFRTWLRTIARNVITDRHRRREGELERRTWTDVWELEHRLVHAVFPEAGRYSPIGPTAADRLIGRILYDAQSVLSEGTRRVVYRKIQFEETWSETAMAIGTTAGGAKRRWQRAQGRLRTEMKERISELPAEVQARVRRRLGMSGDR